jgi:hypothetical protein
MSDQPPQARTRQRPGAAPAATPAANQGGGWFQQGTDGFNTAAQEQARAAEERERGYMPMRYWLAQPKAGQATEGHIIILDDKPSMFFHEHQWKNPQTGKWDMLEACPADFDYCPLCAQEKIYGKRYYQLMLSILDLRGYTDRNGNQVPYTRKLLPIKANMLDPFKRRFEQHGTLRGLCFTMVRSPSEKNSPRIGRPEFYAQYTDEQLLEWYSHPAKQKEDGTVYLQANEMLQPFDYMNLFPQPSGDALVAKYGGNRPVGNTNVPANEAGEWGPPPAATQGAGTPPGAPAGAPPGAPPAAPPAQTAAPAGSAAGGAASPPPAGAQPPAAPPPSRSTELDDEIPFDQQGAAQPPAAAPAASGPPPSVSGLPDDFPV